MNKQINADKINGKTVSLIRIIRQLEAMRNAYQAHYDKECKAHPRSNDAVITKSEINMLQSILDSLQINGDVSMLRYACDVRLPYENKSDPVLEAEINAGEVEESPYENDPDAPIIQPMTCPVSDCGGELLLENRTESEYDTRICCKCGYTLYNREQQ